MALQLIGYWKESLRDFYPFPQEVELALTPAVRSQLSKYLEAGVCVQTCRGYSPCRYGCGQNGFTELSDGVWTWPQGLAHYVREHAVGLPPAFVTHVRSANEQPSPELAQRGLGDARVDDSVWIAWARQYRGPVVAGLLAAALERANARYETALREEAQRLEHELGVTEEPCLEARCTRRALVGMVFCDPCVTKQQGLWWALGAECDALSEVLAQAPWRG